MDLTFPVLSTTTSLLFLLLSLTIGTWLLSSPLILPSTASTHRLLQNKRILLLIAHPDDESMFFAPTILALTRPDSGNHVKILCLSAGEGDGDAVTRENEIRAAGAMLGLKSREDVFVLGPEDTEIYEDKSKAARYIFRDGLGVTWPAEEVANVLRQGFLHSAQSESSKSQKSANKTKRRESTLTVEQGVPTIDILLTFDQTGVSGHSNHKSCFHGARLFQQQLPDSCPMQLYTLTSVTLWRKYISFFDVPITLLIGGLQYLFEFLGISRAENRAIPHLSQTHAGHDLSLEHPLDREYKGHKTTPMIPPRYVFVSNGSDFGKARSAMIHGHKSQMRWFRWGWILIGRYMIVNDLQRQVHNAFSTGASTRKAARS